MDGAAAGPQTHPIAPPLADDLRLLQGEGVDGGYHDAIARLLHLPQGLGHLVIGRLHPGQPGEQGHQVPVVPHGEAGLLRQGIVKQGPGQLQLPLGHARAQVHPGETGPAH